MGFTFLRWGTLYAVCGDVRMKTKDKSEECLTCPTCKLNCKAGYTDNRCVSHNIPGGYFTRDIVHYCLEHKQYHCLTHRQLCMKVYGNSVMTLEAPPPKEFQDEKLEHWKRLDAEVCRLQAWSDQIEYRIIECAECHSTVCQCEDLGDELVVPSILAKQQTIIDEEGDRKTKRIKDYTKYYNALELEEAEDEKEIWEIDMVEKIRLDHLQRTGYTIEETEIREKIRKGEIKL